MPKKRALSSDDEEVGGLAPPPKRGTPSTSAPGSGSRDMFASSTSGSSDQHKENLVERNSQNGSTESPALSSEKQSQSHKCVQPPPANSRTVPVPGTRKRQAEETDNSSDDFFSFGGIEKKPATQSRSLASACVDEEDIFGFGPPEENLSKHVAKAKPSRLDISSDDEDAPKANPPQQKIETDSGSFQKTTKETKLIPVPAFSPAKQTNRTDISLANSSHSDRHLDATGFIGKVCNRYFYYLQYRYMKLLEHKGRRHITKLKKLRVV